MTRKDGRWGWKDMLVGSPSHGKILIVDDEADVRRSLQKLVKGFGYTTRVAASSEEADTWMASERFEACLLDIELPRMKGVEFLGWALSRDPEMAVIMLTGLDDPALAVECIDAGARTYLVKPVESDFLRRALRDALAVRRVLVERNDLISRSRLEV